MAPVAITQHYYDGVAMDAVVPERTAFLPVCWQQCFCVLWRLGSNVWLVVSWLGWDRLGTAPGVYKP